MASTRGERLRAARKRRYQSARAAAATMGIPISTYGAHERAEAPGGRDYGPDEAKRYARRFGTTPEWLLTGRGRTANDVSFPPEQDGEADTPKVRVVGYVGAGAEAHIYAVAQGDLDEVGAPQNASQSTVAVEIRGDSLGSFFNRWLVFYDDVRRPVTADLMGELCVVGLEDGRILIKQVQPGRGEGRFDLISQTGAPIRDAAVEWAAKVKSMVQR